MTRFTLDSATEFLFGSCVHSLTDGLPYPHNVAPPSSFTESIRAASSSAFSKALLEAQKVISDRVRSGPGWPLDEIWQDRTQEMMQVVNGFVEPIIQEALTRKKTGMFDKKVSNEHLEEGETLLDHLVQVIDGKQICPLAADRRDVECVIIDPKVLRDELCAFIFKTSDAP